MDVEPRRHRLIADVGIERAQRLVLPVPGPDPICFAGMLGKIPVHLRATPRLERPVDIGMQVGLGDPGAIHLTVLNLGGPSSVARRNAARPRASRDISVPAGMSSTAAASA